MQGKAKKAFIAKFLKEESLKGRGIWPREMKLINTLLELYPEETFWQWYNPGFKLNSLAWFLGDGKSSIDEAYRAYRFVIDSTVKYSKIPIRDLEPFTYSLPTPPKPKTISEWLRKQLPQSRKK